MFIYNKKLQYPVKIDKPNPKLAKIILTQYGGPDGELGASLRYLSQRYSMPFDDLKGLLTDIGTDASKCTRIGVSPPMVFSEESDFLFELFSLFFCISDFSSLFGGSCFFKFLSCSRTKIHL